jgi:hypothetical protein
MRLGTGLLTCAALLAAATVGEQARAAGTGFATFYALVAAPGTTVRGSGVTTSTRTSIGTYTVTFARDVSDCLQVATLRGQAAGQIAVTPRGGLIVGVTTFSAAGAKQDRPFNLFVECNN